MRQITSDAVRAFRNNEAFSRSNTRVTVDEHSVTLLLHGNPIAQRIDGKLYISACGWLSNTTKERLNGIPGVNICQRNYQWYLNGEPWDGSRTEV